MRQRTEYFSPTVPPDSHAVTAVDVVDVLASVKPVGAVTVAEAMVSPLGNHDAQFH
jgi:hypothetical protein